VVHGRVEGQGKGVNPTWRHTDSMGKHTAKSAAVNFSIGVMLGAL
jgi:hypothetical protein